MAHSTWYIIYGLQSNIFSSLHNYEFATFKDNTYLHKAYHVSDLPRLFDDEINPPLFDDCLLSFTGSDIDTAD